MLIVKIFDWTAACTVDRLKVIADLLSVVAGHDPKSFMIRFLPTRKACCSECCAFVCLLVEEFH